MQDRNTLHLASDGHDETYFFSPKGVDYEVPIDISGSKSPELNLSRLLQSASKLNGKSVEELKLDLDSGIQINWGSAL